VIEVERLSVGWALPGETEVLGEFLTFSPASLNTYSPSHVASLSCNWASGILPFLRCLSHPLIVCKYGDHFWLECVIV